MNLENSIIVLAGPTAVGKSALSVACAKKFNCEIISADSVQVYRDMDIGTAKIKIEEQCNVRHHMIDVLDIDEEMNISLFKSLCNENIKNIHNSGKNVLIAGGSGLYIDSVVYESYNFDTSPKDEKYRRRLMDLAKKNSKEYVYLMLKNLDPEAAKRIHPNNLQRVIRALEICKNGSSHKGGNEKEGTLRKNVFYFVLNMQRKDLYERINSRVDKMFNDGLVDEVRSLVKKGYRNFNALKAIGYKEIIEYIEGDISLDEANKKIKSNSRHFAKRQLTWFRKNKDVIWIEKEKYSSDDEVLNFMEKEICLMKEKK